MEVYQKKWTRKLTINTIKQRRAATKLIIRKYVCLDYNSNKCGLTLSIVKYGGWKHIIDFKNNCSKINDKSSLINKSPFKSCNICTSSHWPNEELLRKSHFLESEDNKHKLHLLQIVKRDLLMNDDCSNSNQNAVNVTKAPHLPAWYVKKYTCMVYL